MSAYYVAAFYLFTSLDDYEDLRDPLKQCMLDHEVIGSILLAQEGINGTIAGPKEGVLAVMDHIRSDPRLAQLEWKESRTNHRPFLRTKVKLKSEIVQMGVEGIDPTKKVGKYVSPKEWNELIQDPDVLVIDTRNDYEVEVGTFCGAVNPKTDTFQEFPAFVRENLNRDKHRKVAMFCTGGIRCEKATSFLLEEGFEEVYHLQGGILKYLEEIPEEESLWQGECFVFDHRITLVHGLEEGTYDNYPDHPNSDRTKEDWARMKGD